VKHLGRSRAEDPGRFVLDIGLVPVDRPAALLRQLGQYLAVHDRIGAALIRHPTLDGDVFGEAHRPRSKRHRDQWFGQCGHELFQRDRRRPDHRRPHVGHQGGKTRVVERLPRAMEVVGAAQVMDRSGRKIGLDQLDPPPVDDLVICRGRDGHGPTEVMRDAETHGADSASRPWSERLMGGH